MTNVFRRKGADFLIAGLGGGFLEKFNVLFVLVDHVLDKLAIKLAARLLAQALIRPVLAIVIVKSDVPVRSNLLQLAVNLLVVLHEFFREAPNFLAGRALRSEGREFHFGHSRIRCLCDEPAVGPTQPA